MMAAISPRQREPNGRQQRETTIEERAREDREKKEAKRMEVIGVALSQPHRRDVKHGKESRLHGFPLGRLFINGIISRQQFAACSRYASTIGKYYSLKGFPTGRYDSICAQMASGSGGISHWEPEDEDVHKAERAANDIQRCLMDNPREFREITKALFGICVWGWDPPNGFSGIEMIGNLRTGANMLARLWEIDEGD